MHPYSFSAPIPKTEHVGKNRHLDGMKGEIHIRYIIINPIIKKGGKFYVFLKCYIHGLYFT